MRLICRSKETEQYKLFEICAIENWNTLIDLELDRIIDNRIKCGLKKQQQLIGQQNSTERDTSTLKQLQDDEKLLIDDIVSHMHRQNRDELYSLLTQDISGEKSSIASNPNKSNENVVATVPMAALSTKHNSTAIKLNDKNVTEQEKLIEKEFSIDSKNTTLAPLNPYSQTLASSRDNTTKSEAITSRSSNTTAYQLTEKPVIIMNESSSEPQLNILTRVKPKEKSSLGETVTQNVSISTKSPFHDVHHDSLLNDFHISQAQFTAGNSIESNLDTTSTARPQVSPATAPSLNHASPSSPAPPTNASPPEDPTLSLSTPPAPPPTLPPPVALALPSTLAPSTAVADSTPSAPSAPPFLPLPTSPTDPADLALSSTPALPIPTAEPAPPADPTPTAPLIPIKEPEPQADPAPSATLTPPAHSVSIPQVPTESETSANDKSAIPTTAGVKEISSLLNGTMEQLNKLDNVTLLAENKFAGIIEIMATTKMPDIVGDVAISEPIVAVLNSSQEFDVQPATGDLQNVTLSRKLLNQAIIFPIERTTAKPTTPTSSNVLIELEGSPTKPFNDYLHLIEIEHTTRVSNTTQTDHHLIGPTLTIDPGTNQSRSHLEIPLFQRIQSDNRANNQTIANVTTLHGQPQQNSNSSNHHHKPHSKRIIMKVKIDSDKLSRGQLPTKEVKKSLLDHGVDVKTVESIIENITPAKLIHSSLNNNISEIKTNLTVADDKLHELLPVDQTIKLNSLLDPVQHNQTPSEKHQLLRTDKLGIDPNKNSSQQQDKTNLHRAIVVRQPIKTGHHDQAAISNSKQITKAHKTNNTTHQVSRVSPTVHNIRSANATHGTINPMSHLSAQTYPVLSHPMPSANHLISYTIPINTIQQTELIEQKTVPVTSASKAPVKTIKRLLVDPKRAHHTIITQKVPERVDTIPRIQSKQPQFMTPHNSLHPLSPVVNHQTFPLNKMYHSNNYQMMPQNPAYPMHFPSLNEYGTPFHPSMNSFSGLPHQPQMNYMMPPNFITGPNHGARSIEPILQSKKLVADNSHRTAGDLHNMEHARQMVSILA